jgi:hypothetical protein
MSGLEVPKVLLSEVLGAGYEHISGGRNGLGESRGTLCRLAVTLTEHPRWLAQGEALVQPVGRQVLQKLNALEEEKTDSNLSHQ